MSLSLNFPMDMILQKKKYHQVMMVWYKKS